MDISADLDLIGGLRGTDKSSSQYNYLVHYDRLFRDIRTEAFNFIEIGIFRGASLATWRQYFDKALVIGVDIQDNCRQYANEGVVVEIGSQDDPGFLSDLVRRYPPRVIIDDGSHLAHHVLFTFETLFPVVEPGGIYVVEDLHFHTGAGEKHHRGHATVNPIEYFLSLARMVAANELASEKQWGFWSYAFRSIDEITFFGHAVAIRKKARMTDLPDRRETVMRLAEAEGTTDAWERASQYLAGNGDRSAAIEALRRGIEVNPLPRLHYQTSLLQVAAGDRAAAMVNVQTALTQTQDKRERAAFLEHLGNMRIGAGQAADGVAAFREALQLAEHPGVRERLEQKISQHV